MKKNFKHNASSIKTTEDKEFISTTEKQRLANIKYSSNIPSTTAIGGVEEGFTGDMELKDLMFKILHPYVQPTVKLSIGTGGSVFEKGETLTNISYTVTATPKAETISTVKMMLNNRDIKVENFTNGLEEVSITGTIANIDQNSNFKGCAIDAIKTTFSGTEYADFVYPAYVGVLNTPVESEIKLMDKRISRPKQQKYSFTLENKKMAIAVPSTWNLSSIIDQNGFNITSSFILTTVPISCLDKTTQQYKVYTSNNTSQTGFTVTFNF